MHKIINSVKFTNKQKKIFILFKLMNISIIYNNKTNNIYNILYSTF